MYKHHKVNVLFYSCGGNTLQYTLLSSQLCNLKKMKTSHPVFYFSKSFYSFCFIAWAIILNRSVHIPQSYCSVSGGLSSLPAGPSQAPSESLIYTQVGFSFKSNICQPQFFILRTWTSSEITFSEYIPLQRITYVAKTSEQSMFSVLSFISTSLQIATSTEVQVNLQ